MLPIEEYLERRGAKYFVTVLMLFYVLGTVIFNVYLRSIGLYQFDLLQLRYMFVGFSFGLITLIVPLVLLSIKRFFWGKGEDWTKKEKKEREKIQDKIEKVVLVLFIPWVMVYALYIFPLISPGFGGVKPIEARLIGETDRIQKINTIIARETGVDSSTLPFEEYDEVSNLAVGANVQIIDQNKDRYLLLLTKDLYLSSQSRVAKQLIDAGEGADLETAGTKDFKSKPLVMSAEGIETITLSLYEPPEVLTTTDLELATRVLADASSQESTKAVTDAIRSVEPDEAEKVIAAVTKSAQTIKTNTPVAVQPTASNPIVTKPSLDFATIEEALEETIDTVWIGMRSAFFNKGTALQGAERSGIQTAKRNEFVTFVESELQSLFPVDYIQLRQGPDDYWTLGVQSDPDFARKMVNSIRGADGAVDFVSRVNALVYTAPIVVTVDFVPVRDVALGFFDESLLTNDTQANRNYISQKLIQHFSKEAPTHSSAWQDTQYLVSGKDDENFAVKLRTALRNSSDWDLFEQKLTLLFINKDLPEEAPEEDEEVVVVPPVVVEPEIEEPVVEVVPEIVPTEEPVVTEPVTVEPEIEEPIVEPTPETVSEENTEEVEPDAEEPVVDTESETTPSEDTPEENAETEEESPEEEVVVPAE